MHRGHAIPLVAVLLVFTTMATLGFRYHWVEEAGSAERDGYVAKAETLLEGRLPADPYRPLLYPILVAGVGAVMGSSFAAARLVSNLAAAAVLLLAWLLGRRLGGGPAGAWSLALTAVNPNLWILGQHTTTDVLFAALAAATLFCGLLYLEADETAARGWALAAGLGLGLATFTRGNGLFLFPGLLVAGLLRGAASPRRRLGDGLVAAGSAILVLVPHWILRWKTFGHPFHDENWKNLAWKLYGFPDWSYLERVPFDGPVDVLRHDPLAWVSATGGELLRFATSGAAQLLGTWLHVVLALGGVALLLRRRPRPTLYLLISSGSFLVLVAFSFFTWGRLLLLLLPVAHAFAGALLAAGEVQARGRWPATPLRHTGSAAAALLVALVAVKTLFFRWPAFVERHPYTEVRLLRRLEERHPDARFAGTSPFLGRYLDERARYVAIPDAFGAEIENPGRYYARLEDLLTEARAEFLVVGAVDLRDRPPELLGPRPPVPWLRFHLSRGRVTVWRVAGRDGGA